MDYSDLEHQIRNLASSASTSQHHRFAQDTLSRLLAISQTHIRTEFNESECRRLQTVLETLLNDKPACATEELDALRRSIASDDSRAVSFDQSILALISALDWYNTYLSAGNSSSIAQLAFVQIEFIDFNVHGEVPGYSHSNVMAAPEMVAEWNRIVDSLG